MTVNVYAGSRIYLTAIKVYVNVVHVTLNQLTLLAVVGVIDFLIYYCGQCCRTALFGINNFSFDISEKYIITQNCISQIKTCYHIFMN